MTYKNKEIGRLKRRIHYKNNKNSYAESVKRTRLRRREWLDQQKNKPCSECGKQYHPVAMDFHHKDRKNKLFEVNSSAILRSITALETEINKCDLLCAVCHRLIEANLIIPGSSKGRTEDFES